MLTRRTRQEDTNPAYRLDMPDTNEYYFSLSQRFKLAKYVVFLSLILFIVFMVTGYGEEITVENLRYLLKYMDTQQGSVSENYTDFRYDVVDGADFHLYKGDLVVSGTDGFDIYDINGKHILNAKYEYLNPTLLVSEQYILVYDLGGNSFSLYNSFGLLYEETLNYPIGCASIGDTGNFLIVTRAKEYRSVVYCYNKDFKRIYSWHSSDKYVLSATMDPLGSQFVIAASTVSDRGYFKTEVLICNPNSEDKKAQKSFEDEAVIASGFFADQSYVLLSDKALYLFDSFHAQKAQYSYPGSASPSAFYYSEETGHTMLAFHENVVGNESSVIFLNASGETVYQGTVEGDICDVKFGTQTAYILTDDAIRMVDLTFARHVDYSPSQNPKKLFPISSDLLLVCYPSVTEVKNINEIFF